MIQEARKKLNQLLTQYEQAKLRVKEEKQALAKAEQDTLDAKEAQQITQVVALATQQAAHDKIASIVSRCLETIFDDPYEFQIEFQEKRGRTEALCQFKRDGEVYDPLTAAGGGVVDVAAFALRVACIVLSRPACRRLLVADEPFRFLSAHYRPRVAEMLMALSKELGIQIIMVTHSKELEIGKVVDIGEE